MSFNPEKLAKLQGKKTQLGGKGSMRRKRKVQHKASVDDKKVTAAISKAVGGMKDLPAIVEANLFVDQDVINFKRPKVSASLGANTFVLSGQNERKPLKDLLPGIISHLGNDPETLSRLYSAIAPGAADAAAAGAADEDDDDDVPDLVDGTFEDAAAAKEI